MYIYNRFLNIIKSWYFNISVLIFSYKRAISKLENYQFTVKMLLQINVIIFRKKTICVTSMASKIRAVITKTVCYFSARVTDACLRMAMFESGQIWTESASGTDLIV